MDKYNSEIATLIGTWTGAKQIFGITISKNTTLYNCPKDSVPERLRRHEDWHKKQYADEGWLKFIVKYLFYNIVKGYQNNPYEVEARLAENHDLIQ